ncbi:hypothetical protein HG535_0C05090 [Zygotorulaspora mrakii]|uniref:Peptidase M20 dimerisation domain-containing protein n=1 Tax=Zygotorulaspora mrakii TaxID=42260 RepID=A0A7H9B0E2_ZYGMR|nr:uncharacterized protein HG535_0C05090 [Zygotorulaspora mrakii]QLG72155.1 hypothetical protein HG535_0C05090 [Zygotorulaspora mrakii]
MSFIDPELVHKWGHTFSIISIVPFPKKELLFAGTQDSKILVFNLCTYNLVRTIRLGDSHETNTRSSVLCLERSIDENYLFSGGTDSLVRIWSIYDVDRQDGSVQVEEVATVYSVTDIGDIFSLQYLDSLQTLVFGCQNASLLYLDNVFDRLLADTSQSSSSMNRLPHLRYDKFFDSLGPSGHTSHDHASKEPSHLRQTELSSNALRKSISQEGAINQILEIPSENIIPYAHNGFVYSICKLCLLCSSLLGNDVSFKYPVKQHDCQHAFECKEGANEINECIISGGGDGISKVWFLKKDREGSVSMNLIATELNNEETVLAQATEFPFLYCGLSDGIVKIWDLSTKQVVSTLYTPDKSDIISISVYKDHIFAINEAGVTLFYENEIRHWNPQRGKMLSCDVFARFSKSSEKQMSLLVGSNDGSLTLWDLSSVLSYGNAKDYLRNGHIHPRESFMQHSDPVQLNNEDMLSTLRELIAFPSVSQSADTLEKLASRRCASYLQKLFMRLGAESSQLLALETGDNPIVFASFKGKATSTRKQRILWYGHYDVIPASNDKHWKSDPYTLTCEDGYMKGRGVSDNKGPLIAAIYSVASLLNKGELSHDIVFLVEGNEEIGSPGLEQVCKDNLELIGPNIDWIFLSNSTWVDQTHPCLNYGLRGVINAQISITSDESDRHSGIDGGTHREPTAELVNVVSKLQDDSGKILIPNFYDALKPISPQDRKRLEKIIEVASFNKKKTVEELVMNWTKPSLSVTTMRVSGPGNISVIPQCALIGISIRLVPEQGVAEVKAALNGYLTECFDNLKSKNHLKIEIVNSAEAWLGDPTNHAYKIIRDEIANAWKVEPLFVKEGGSIPCIRPLERIFNAPAVQIACGQSTDNAHLDNENLRIENWSKMAIVLSNVFRKL